MRKAIVFLVAATLLSPWLVGHPRHSNPVLGELNDYLAALQLLKATDPEAADLFRRWIELRDESWKIRQLTEKEGYFSSDAEVVAQVQKTAELRQQLRERCVLYFDSRMATLPSASIDLGQPMSPAVEHVFFDHPAGERRLVLIRLENPQPQTQHLELAGDPGSQILFWRESVEVAGNSKRFCFAYSAPAAAGTHANTIRIERGPVETSRVSIAVEALPAPPHPAPTLPDRRIEIRVRDALTHHPLPARAEITDLEGTAYWEPLQGTAYAVSTSQYGRWETPLWPLQPGPYFYLNGQAILGVDPHNKTARIFHGFEYRPAEAPVPDNGRLEVDLQRWIDMPARGWYSGQTHIHTTEQGLPVPFFDSWPLISQAEGLQVSHILTLKGEWTTQALYANEYPMGPIPLPHDPEHIVVYGEEYRSNPYGHLALLDLEELIQPISSGALGELGGPDYPSNAFVLDQALSQGATTVGAHFGLSVLEGQPIGTPWPSTGFEMPIDVALGKMQVAEVYGNGGQQAVWYGLLNCGFNLPATAGPDWVLKDTPRTYVYLGQEQLTGEAWTRALRLGRSFVTRGPMIFLTVDGHRPGARIQTDQATAEVTLEATAVMPEGPIPVEIVVNGEVVAQGKELKRTLRLEDSAWIAARCPDAHTNPVYLDLPGRPRGYREDAETFIHAIKRLENWVREKGIFESAQQRDSVLEVISEGMTVYRQIADRAQLLGREK